MAKTKIAIIEDDMAIVQMYRMKFEAQGYEIVTAGDGQAGLALIEKEQPDVVLLDLMMPEMTGDEMLAELRLHDWGEDIPVIILTNMGENEAPKSVRENGVHDFIVKAHMTPKDVAGVIKRRLQANG